MRPVKKAVHFYRGQTIFLNTKIKGAKKWLVFEIDDIEADTLTEAKNLIDISLGGYATAKKPKRLGGRGAND